LDTIRSAEFRMTYARLRRPTIVTVNGHTIGYWTPGIPPVDAIDVGGAPETRPVGLRPTDVHPRLASPFAEYRPVPKPGKR
jgi:hypothetical protein